MHDTRYMISEASKRVDVEQHTLRYWEEELNIHILRNEMGHRYYREEDIEVLRAVKILKEKGYQLRAIKMLLPEIERLSRMGKVEIEKMQQEWDKKYMDDIAGETMQSALTVQGEDKMEEPQEMIVEKSAERLEQFKNIMGRLITEAIEDNNEALSEVLSESITTSVIKEMDYLLRIKEEREEERFKKFDRTLREMQQGRAEIAVGKSERIKKKGIFHKKIYT